MESNRWFHHVNGVNAEKILMESGTDGSFLARPSDSTPGSFTLSVRRNNDVTHIKIQNTDDFLDLFGGEKFATLSELVSYYMQNRNELKEKNGQVIELKYPLFSSDPTTERWFHRDINGKDAEKMLLEKGRNGSFLVRESMRIMGSYVVSVLTGDRVDHVMIYRRPTGKFDIGGGRKFETLKDLVDFYVTTPMVEKSGTLVSLIHPFNATRVKAIGIKERMSQLEKDSGHGPYCQAGFLEEFDELQQDGRSKHFSRDEGFKLYNAEKNRYRNILPFDKTRVILKDGDPNVNGSDYINANYINWPYETDHGSDPQSDANSINLRYISTQGTLENTIIDFWRMVWQEKSIVIVMITKETEKGKNKCVRYWPTPEDQNLTLDTYEAKLVISNLSEQHNETFILRELLLTRVSNNDGLSESFKLYHYHFIAWPDHGTPKEPFPLLNFMEETTYRQLNSINVGPMIVHCSAGIGRSGAFIAIDIIINQIKADFNRDIDILRTVQIIREQRSGMVQTETQYRFVYVTVQEFINLEKNRHQTLLDAMKCGREYTNLNRFPDLVSMGNFPPASQTIDINADSESIDVQIKNPNISPRNETVDDDSHIIWDHILQNSNNDKQNNPPLPKRRGESQ